MLSFAPSTRVTDVNACIEGAEPQPSSLTSIQILDQRHSLEALLVYYHLLLITRPSIRVLLAFSNTDGLPRSPSLINLPRINTIRIAWTVDMT
jgi:hypothetical protein